MAKKVHFKLKKQAFFAAVGKKFEKKPVFLMVKNTSFCSVLDNPPFLPQSFHLSPSSRHSNLQSRPLSLQSSLELPLIWVSRFVGWLRI